MSKMQEAMSKTAQASPFDRFRSQVNQLRPEIAAMVGKDNVDRFIRVCLNAVQANPAVLEADRKSLLLAAFRAAQDRLLPDGREAVFNIYRTKVKLEGHEQWVEVVQYLPMVGGLIKKLYDSGHVTFVDAVAVRERDEFEYHRGDEPRIIHKPHMGDDSPGKVVAAYAVIKLKNGEVKREVMSRRDIEVVRSKSKAPNGPMWDEDAFYDQAAIKSVIKRAYKQLPSSYEMEGAIAADNEAIGLADAAAPVSQRPASSDLEALIDGRLAQQLRDQATTGGASKTGSEVMAGSAGARAAGTQGGPGLPAGGETVEHGTQAQRDGFLAAFRECKDVETLSLKRDEANFLEWTKPDLTLLDDAYKAKLAELKG